jgi:hypothetical protein
VTTQHKKELIKEIILTFRQNGQLEVIPHPPPSQASTENIPKNH